MHILPVLFPGGEVAQKFFLAFAPVVGLRRIERLGLRDDLLLFGAKRLPELAKGLGKSIREFKKATSEVEENIRDAMKEEDTKKPESKPEKTETPKGDE